MAGVSIVIPVYNREQYLPTLFRSLSAVDYEELEVLLVDNGSTDDSLLLCRSFAEEAPMVVRVCAETRRGANCARNLGLMQCRTEWVYFFDSDDLLTPSFLKEIMPRVADCDMVAFPVMQQRGDDLIPRAFRPSASPASQILSLTLSTQSMLFRTDFLRRIGGWNERLQIWQDWELGIRVLLHRARILWLPDSAYHHIRIHPDSITGASFCQRRDVIRQTLEIVSHELHEPRDLRALYLRTCIVNGQLQRQGGHLLKESYRLGWFTRLLGTILRSYAYCGGRGAWRIALLVC